MKQRVITGLFWATVFVVLAWFGGVWFSAFVSLIAIVGYYEFIRMLEKKWYNLASLVGFILLSYFLLFGMTEWTFSIEIFPLLWIIVFLLLLITVLSKNNTTILDVSSIFLGAFYVGLGFHYLKMIRLEYGVEWFFLIVASVWATDIGAYICGSMFGKRPLWPHISPNKTVEGSLGGILFSILIALSFSLLLNALSLSIIKAIVIGLIISIIGQLGDLIESALKRFLKVKDSGQILPGHGGILDRFDSKLTVFPFLFIIFQYIL